jgi:hypothetical protein
MKDDDGLEPALARLRDVIAEELNVQLNMLRRPMTFDDVPAVAKWLAVQIDYAFKTEWAPRWEGKRAPDSDPA